MAAKIFEENGVVIGLEEHHENPTKSRTFFNPVMKISREFQLSALAALVKKHTTNIKLKCLDAFGATGVSGLQWHHHLKDHISVTINDNQPQCVEDICKNCATNKVSVNVFSACLSPTSGPQANTEGKTHNEGPTPISSHDTETAAADVGLPSTVDVVHGDANVIMHLHQFHFITVDPFGTTVQYLDAAFKNVYNGGIVVLVSTDVAALYAKCPDVVFRNYNARVVRTDCTKELAARLVLGAAARSASRCNKGLQVLYTVAVEHFVQVAVRICRGAKLADSSLQNVRSILHCQMCETNVSLPLSGSPQENVHRYLTCTCNEDTKGSSNLLLGPGWCGELIDRNFVTTMLHEAKNLSLSRRIQQLLMLILEEEECSITPKSTTAQNETTNVDVKNLSVKSEKRKHEKEVKEPHKKQKIDETDTKHEGSEEQGTRLPMPMFFYNLHKRRLKGLDIPKINKMVTDLQISGYRASRTHFDPMGIRTSATLAQLKAVLTEHSEAL